MQSRQKVGAGLAPAFHLAIVAQREAAPTSIQGDFQKVSFISARYFVGQINNGNHNLERAAVSKPVGKKQTK